MGNRKLTSSILLGVFTFGTIHSGMAGAVANPLDASENNGVENKVDVGSQSGDKKKTKLANGSLAEEQSSELIYTDGTKKGVDTEENKKANTKLRNAAVRAGGATLVIGIPTAAAVIGKAVSDNGKKESNSEIGVQNLESQLQVDDNKNTPLDPNQVDKDKLNKVDVSGINYVRLIVIFLVVVPLIVVICFVFRYLRKKDSVKTKINSTDEALLNNEIVEGNIFFDKGGDKSEGNKNKIFFDVNKLRDEISNKYKEYPLNDKVNILFKDIKKEEVKPLGLFFESVKYGFPPQGAQYLSSVFRNMLQHEDFENTAAANFRSLLYLWVKIGGNLSVNSNQSYDDVPAFIKLIDKIGDTASDDIFDSKSALGGFVKLLNEKNFGAKAQEAFVKLVKNLNSNALKVFVGMFSSAGKGYDLDFSIIMKGFVTLLNGEGFDDDMVESLACLFGTDDRTYCGKFFELIGKLNGDSTKNFISLLKTKATLDGKENVLLFSAGASRGLLAFLRFLKHDFVSLLESCNKTFWSNFAMIFCYGGLTDEFKAENFSNFIFYNGDTFIKLMSCKSLDPDSAKNFVEALRCVSSSGTVEIFSSFIDTFKEKDDDGQLKFMTWFVDKKVSSGFTKLFSSKIYKNTTAKTIAKRLRFFVNESAKSLNLLFSRFTDQSIDAFLTLLNYGNEENVKVFLDFLKSLEEGELAQGFINLISVNKKSRKSTFEASLNLGKGDNAKDFITFLRLLANNKNSKQNFLIMLKSMILDNEYDKLRIYNFVDIISKLHPLGDDNRLYDRFINFIEDKDRCEALMEDVEYEKFSAYNFVQELSSEDFNKENFYGKFVVDNP